MELVGLTEAIGRIGANPFRAKKNGSHVNPDRKIVVGRMGHQRYYGSVGHTDTDVFATTTTFLVNHKDWTWLRGKSVVCGVLTGHYDTAWEDHLRLCPSAYDPAYAGKVRTIGRFAALRLRFMDLPTWGDMSFAVESACKRSFAPSEVVFQHYMTNGIGFLCEEDLQPFLTGYGSVGIPTAKDGVEYEQLLESRDVPYAHFKGEFTGRAIG